MDRYEIQDAIAQLPEDEQTELARSILRRLHYAEVRSIARELASEIKASRVQTQEDADRWIHETVDGHERVVYTARNLDVLLASENWEAREAQTGEAMPDWQLLAYWALYEDIRDEVECDETIQAALRGEEDDV